MQALDRIIFGLIDKSKERIAKKSSCSNENDAVADTRFTNVLDMMVDANSAETDESKKMTNEELRNNVAVFFIAGHETVRKDDKKNSSAKKKVIINLIVTRPQQACHLVSTAWHKIKKHKLSCTLKSWEQSVPMLKTL